ncbi:hypothetical protein JCM8208_001139 [Rhodotorula glutinis]
MAALRITPPSSTGSAWQPVVSPISPGGDSSSSSLSARCRYLASRLGGSAVHDDAHFEGSASTSSAPASPHRTSPSPSPGRSPRVGTNLASPSNPPPSFPLSPRSSLLGFDAAPQHILDEIREEEDGGESTPKVEQDMTSAWAPPRLAVPGQATDPQQQQFGHNELVSPGTVTKPLPGGYDVGGQAPPSPTRSYGTASRTASTGSQGSSRRPSFASSMLLDLQQGEDDDDTDMEEATIEERENELRQALKDGATWLGVDLWLVDGEVLVASSQSSLDPSRTFSATVVQPLLRIFSPQDEPTFKIHRRRSSVYTHVKPHSPFQLVIRLRTPATTTFPYVVSDLEPLHDASLLTMYCPNAGSSTAGLITVVSSSANGAEMVPFEQLSAVQGQRFVYRDAPLAAFDSDKSLARSGVDPALTPVAAGALVEVTGWDGQKSLSDEQRERIRAQVERAHAHGLKVRFEALPNFPVHVREQCRQALLALGADYL